MSKKPSFISSNNFNDSVLQPNNFFHRFLQLMASQNTPLSMGSDYKIALLCNAYSTSVDLFNRPMAVLVDSIQGIQKVSFIFITEK